MSEPIHIKQQLIKDTPVFSSLSGGGRLYITPQNIASTSKIMVKFNINIAVFRKVEPPRDLKK